MQSGRNGPRSKSGITISLDLASHMRDGLVEQQIESFWCRVDLLSFREDRGTSFEGFRSKKLTGFSETIILSLGITGKSGNWSVVCHIANRHPV